MEFGYDHTSATSGSPAAEQQKLSAQPSPAHDVYPQYSQQQYNNYDVHFEPRGYESWYSSADYYMQNSYANFDYISPVPSSVNTLRHSLSDMPPTEDLVDDLSTVSSPSLKRLRSDEETDSLAKKSRLDDLVQAACMVRLPHHATRMTYPSTHIPTYTAEPRSSTRSSSVSIARKNPAVLAKYEGLLQNSDASMMYVESDCKVMILGPNMSDVPGNASFFGYVNGHVEAEYIFAMARRGECRLTHARLNEVERSQIDGGFGYVYAESSSGIRRWTDGYLWKDSYWQYNRKAMLYKEAELCTGPTGKPQKVEKLGGLRKKVISDSKSDLKMVIYFRDV
eukprot:Clim_evm48s55 gene=Clim_evmTU48s55